MISYDISIMNLLKGDTPRQKHENLKKAIEIIEAKWSDEIRLGMVDKAPFYGDATIYAYGYYDGYMKAIELLDNILNKKQ